MIMLLTAALLMTTALGANPIETVWGGPAELTYAEGFARNVRLHASGGVCLFDMELIENDAAGAGKSEKGVSGDVLWGNRRARKIVHLDDPRTLGAYIVLFAHRDELPHPLHFAVNGRRGAITKDNRETYRWVEFPASALEAGENIIELWCPDAESPEEGWDLYIARADEFTQGGGDPRLVGETSFRSDDGGETWKQSPFGPDEQTRAEYAVRLSLDRYRPEGALETPVIDLWKGGSSDPIVPMRALAEVTFEVDADVPVGTKVEYYMRRGTDPSPFGDAWEPYEPIGSGASVRATIDGETLNRRYAQFRAVLTTSNPTVTPVLRSVSVRAQVINQVTPLDNVFVMACDNPVMRYPSIDWQWEQWNRPEFQELRKRENLDEVIAGSRTQFQAQVKLMDHATKRWRAGGPLPEYPGWDALSILDRIDKAGSGGMCIQGNNFLGGMCMAYGWQARLVNITAHETCEVWNDDFGKWVYLDGYYVNHYIFDEKTGEPLSILEMHQRFLDTNYPDRPIDWMKDSLRPDSAPEDYAVGLGIGGARHGGHNGISLAAFARMVPRNNWYESPYPRPLTHGCTWWPWDGYVNWYDDRTPPKRQYSWHTDRPQDMWPDLNRVHLHATSGAGNDRLFLRFETYTPNLSHFEIDVDGTGWKEVGERWVWLLQSGKNTIRVRAVSHLGTRGKPTTMELNRVELLG
jgi:hypothetical protein